MLSGGPTLVTTLVHDVPSFADIHARLAGPLISAVLQTYNRLAVIHLLLCERSLVLL